MNYFVNEFLWSFFVSSINILANNGLNRICIIKPLIPTPISISLVAGLKVILF